MTAPCDPHRWLLFARARLVWACAAWSLLWMAAGCGAKPETAPPPAAGSFRFATFNTALSRDEPGELASALAMGADPQAKAVAEIIQRVRPHVLLIQEFDHDPSGRSLELFVELYLREAQAEDVAPIDYAYSFTPHVNTGQLTGYDLDGDGSPSGPGDAYGWGAFPGQYGMAVLSQLPLDQDRVRTFRNLRWTAMPGAGP
ncbi:MAG: endonuclease/exonuclease/phosphatase family protein, partial [Planctomycetota bacterium]